MVIEMIYFLVIQKILYICVYTVKTHCSQRLFLSLFILTDHAWQYINYITQTSCALKYSVFLNVLCETSSAHLVYNSNVVKKKLRRIKKEHSQIGPNLGMQNRRRIRLPDRRPPSIVLYNNI